MNNQKSCFFCKHRDMKLMPIKNKQGYVMSLHNICQTCNKDQTQRAIEKRKSSLSSKKITKRIKKTCHTSTVKNYAQGIVTIIAFLVLTVWSCHALASFEMPVSEVIYVAPTLSTSTTEKKEIVSVHETIKEKIWRIAGEHNISPTKLNMVIWNESHYNVKAKGDMDIICPSTGKPVEARGLGQITKCYHPEVSDKEAYDEDFAIEWVATQIENKHCGKEFTTCRL